MGDGERRNVRGDDTAGSDHGAASDAHPAQDRDVRPDPSLIFNDHRPAADRLVLDAGLRRRAMRAVGDIGVGPDEDIAAHLNPLVRVQHRVAVHIRAMADLDLPRAGGAAAQQHHSRIQRATMQSHIRPLARDLDAAEPAILPQIGAEQPVKLVAHPGGQAAAEAVQQLNHEERREE
jgi:hypothetical protein